MRSLIPSGEQVDPVPHSMEPDGRDVFDPPEPKYHPEWKPLHELKMIRVDRIAPNLHQPRRSFDPVALASLGESIKVAGVIQPIIVQVDVDRYRLIAGERRWRAAQVAGCIEIPAIVRPHIDSVQQSQLALIENIHRQDLNPIERAIAYKSMLDGLDLTHQELATKLGEERSSITNYTRLLDLAAAVQELVTVGKLTLGHAKLLVSISDSSEQVRIAQIIVTQQLSVRNLEKLIKEAPPTVAPPPPPAPRNPHFADLERQISRDLQMRTEVRQAKKDGKGRIVIHYASLDQFDQLMQRLKITIDD